MPKTDEEVDWWERIGQMRWQHIVLIVAAVAAFVALSFVPLKCGVSITQTPEPTTTTVPR